MKRILLFLTIISAYSAAMAQITIQSTDIGSIGDQVTYVTDTTSTGTTVTAPTGNSQIFNYTGLGVADFGNILFLNPALTPSAAFFPNSNLAIDVPGSNLIYAIKSTSELQIDGVFGDILGQGFATPIDLKPNLSLVPFPLNYQDAYTDFAVVDTVVEDTFSNFFDSLRLKRTIEVVSLVDAYGQLQLPNLTDDVLRVHQMEITTDSLFGKILGFWQPVTQSTLSESYYRFLAKNRGYYIMELHADSLGVIIDAQYQTGGALISGILNYSNISCNGLTNGMAKVEATGGTLPYSYMWNNPASSITAQINNLAAGTYTVTVTDGAGDTSVTQITISEPDTISVNSALTGPDYGANEGFINLNVFGGTPPYTYLWSNGQVSKNASNLAAGIYSVTVTDSRNCTQTASFTIDNLSSVMSLSNDKFAVFPNPSVGQITLNTTHHWKLKMYTMSGTLVKEVSGIGTKQIQISDNPAGLYILEIQIDEERYMGKIQLLK